MDSRKMCLLLLWIIEVIICMQCVLGNLVFDVQHKYGARGNGKAKAALEELRAHDLRRHSHSRTLSALEFQLGGEIWPTKGFYYTKITIGTPPVAYHVLVDTGSDVTWVACRNCKNCPTKSDLKIPMNRYDLMASNTAQKVTCNQEFCSVTSGRPRPNCKAGVDCEYTIEYGDGFGTEGYYVRDYFSLDQVTGDLRTSIVKGSVVFGCSLKQSGQLDSSHFEVDGIVGFGPGNTSLLSQLALSGKVKKVISHCLSRNNGGGILAIGEVLRPRVKRTPLVPNKSHYNVFLEAIEVGGEFLNLTTSDKSWKGSSTAAMIDSGTTLAYFPSQVYRQLINKMMQKHPDMKIYTGSPSFKCFRYGGNVDDVFPVVTFHVRNSINLSVPPHDYLFQVRKKEYCIGWQSNTENTEKIGLEPTVLGDMVLADKLVVYDLETHTMGWTPYNCSSSIRVKDVETGNAYEVAAHILSPSGHYEVEPYVVAIVVYAILIFTASLVNVYYEC